MRPKHVYSCAICIQRQRMWNFYKKIIWIKLWNLPNYKCVKQSFPHSIQYFRCVAQKNRTVERRTRITMWIIIMVRMCHAKYSCCTINWWSWHVCLSCYSINAHSLIQLYWLYQRWPSNHFSLITLKPCNSLASN